jgi:large repetitive protein
MAGLALAGLSLVAVPSASADPAPGPGAVSRSTAGALATGTIPDGTCAARVTALGGGGASSPVSAGFGGTGGAGASISATFDVLPGQSYGGSVGGGGTLPNGGSGNGAIGVGGDGGTIVNQHRGGGGGGRSSVDLGGTTVLVAGAGGGGGAAHQVAPAGVGGGGGFTGIVPGTVAAGSDGQDGVDNPGTANGGQGGQAAAGGAGGTNTGNAAQNGGAGGGIGVGTGGDGGPDPNYDSGGGGGGGYTGGGGGASTVDDTVSGAGGGGGSSWVSGTSPTNAGAAPTSVSGSAGPASPVGQGSGATGSIAIDWVPCLYALSIDKSVSAASVNAGGAVTWTVTITNDGPDPMTRGDTVTLTDLLPPGPNGGPAPAFEVLSFSVSGGTNAEMSRGAVICTGLSVGSSMPATTTCSRAYSAPGAPEAPSGGLRGLDPGETITITYRQIIANTAPCDTITNTASTDDRATSSGSSDVVGVVATQSDNAALTIECYDLAITKVASPTPVRAGRTLTWTITVTNTGPGDMEGPTATDANPLVVSDVFPSTNVGAASLLSASGPAGACNLAGNTITCGSGLDSGAQEVLTITQVVDVGATSGATIANTASVTDPTTSDSNDDDTDQTTVAAPGLSMVKTPDRVSYTAVGDVINYDYVVTNTGDVALAGPVTVSDDVTTVTCPPTPSLAPAASVTCTASHTITQADLNSGDVTNTATASADGVTSAPDSATVNAAQGPALNLAKSADISTYTAVGTVIHYMFVVTNSGNVTLSGPFSVSDNRSTNESCPATVTLAPGNSITCTASHTVTQADIDAGAVTNVASATNGTVTSNNDSVTVSADQNPGLSLVKTASNSSFKNAGDVVHYQYVVGNTGNTTLAGPVGVADDKTSVTCPPLSGIGDGDANLDPGESVTCTASYTVTQADVEARRVTNAATASAGGIDSATRQATVTRQSATLPPTDTEPTVRVAEHKRTLRPE